MTKITDIPAIRFKGFSDTWEQRKLSEIATMHARIGWQNLRTSEFLDNGDYMLITGTDFMDGAVNFDTCHYVERERYEQDKHIQIRNGSILITKDGTLGKVAYIQGLTMPATLNAGVFNVEIRDEKEVDNRYLFQYLKAPFLMDYVDKKATGGTIKHLNQNILVDFPVVLPQKDEQAKIGEYFLGIDNLITLHQRKYDKLTNVKKSMLGKMFPQNGSNVPEIRFKGFTEAWEQRKFSDLVQIERGGSPRPIDDFITDSPDGLNWVKIGDAPAQGNYITKTAEKIKPEGLSKTREVHPGDLILSNSMSFGKPYIMGIDGCIHDGWLLIRNTYKVFDLTFLCHLLGTPQMIIQYKSLAAGSTVNNLNKELVGNTVVTIPTIKEQRVLGQYLETLDNLITLHQREFVFLCKEKIEIIRYIKNTWEQRKVGDLLIERNQQAPMSDEYPLMAFIANEGVAPKGDRYDRSALVTDTANKLYKKTEIGDFIYSSNNLETGSIGLNKYGKACISPVYSIFEPTGIADSDFLGRRLVRKDFINAMVKWRQGVIYGQWRIHESDFLKIEIPVPSVVEQRKIGAYLDQLDRLITLHQRKPNFYTGGYYAE